MRRVDKLIIHCSATREGQEISVETIKKWHVEDNGWSDIGYHFVIDLKGEVHEGRPVERTGAHTKGANYGSIGICYVGGCDEDLEPKDTRTQEQKDALEDLLLQLKDHYPKAVVYGHRDFSTKACPSFDAKSEYAHISYAG